jgi:hypothetical protein
MREVSPGDVVFSFADGQVKAIGVLASHAYESPKPLAFGSAGANWDNIGWRVDAQFVELQLPIRPRDYMGVLGPLLPKRYAPLQPSGNGLQSVYLTYLREDFAAALIDAIGSEARSLVSNAGAMEPGAVAGLGLVQWEEHQLAEIQADEDIPETTRQAVVQARRGQGLFKQNVMKIERACRLTGVDKVEHLRASHCKPWRDSTNKERLDGNNGLLLTPDADHLFDRGFITFEDSGKALTSPVAHLPSLKRMGLDPAALPNKGPFNADQAIYLKFHRENVFLQARLEL